MPVKSSRMAPGLANARPPGSAKFANAPPPGLSRRANSPQQPGGWGWAQVELTDALVCTVPGYGSFTKTTPRYDQYPTQAQSHITPRQWQPQTAVSSLLERINMAQPARSHHHSIFKTKLNVGLALRQTADLLKANISANKISLPQGQSYTERNYLLTAPEI